MLNVKDRMKRPQRRRKLPFRTTLPPDIAALIDMVCNDWCEGISSEDRLDTINLLRSLPLKQRIPMVLKAQGYSFAEIGNVTGRKQSAVFASFRLAERNIRGKLSGNPNRTTGRDC